jgi:hypothetical protein
MKTAVEFLVEKLAENGILHSSDIEEAKEMEDHLAQQYAEFSILCDRRGMNPIKFKDFIKQYKQ